MTGTITTTLQTSPRPRIGVQLGSWVSPTAGILGVFRVHPDTSEYPVRGSGDGGDFLLSGGAGFAWDYEAPFGVPVTYYAFDGATKVVSSPVTIPTTTPYLIVPGLPGYDVAVKVMGQPVVARARPAVKLYPLGRPTPIVLVDSRKAGEFQVTLRTKSDTDANAVDLLLDQGAVCLLVLPGVRLRTSWQYVTVTADSERPVVAYRAGATDPTTAVGHWIDWPLTCTVVSRPDGGIFGDPTASYQVIKDTYATYTALKAAKATYVDVLKGV